MRPKLLCHKLVELQRLSAVMVEPTPKRLSQQFMVEARQGDQVTSVSCPYFLNREVLFYGFIRLRWGEALQPPHPLE